MRDFPRRIKSKLQQAKHRLLSKPEAPSNPMPTFTAHFNSPESDWVKESTVSISGWLLPGGNEDVKGLRIKNGTQITQMTYGSKRYDVLNAYPNLDPQKALHSGFSKKIHYEEGLLEVEVDLGRGWQLVRSFNLKYSPEDLVDMLQDPNLSTNWAEHVNLFEGKDKYYYESEGAEAYVRHASDPRLVAFHLPQFHPIAENDHFWGKGFTEWTNVTSAKPRFVEHRQPLLPGELGFYDLRLEESVHAQIELAKKHGIYGFCYYYYWFSGKRLLEKPLDIILKHKEWDFNFMIAWANENWTKRWDGLDNEVIVAQKYLDTDPLDFIKDVEPILLDPRYIREDGKPVLVVYRGSKLGDPAKYVKAWREYFLKKHKQELHILSVLGLDTSDPRKFGFDGGIEFEPLTAAKRIDFNKAKPHPPNIYSRLLDKQFKGGIADYRQIALFDTYAKPVFHFPTYKSVMPSWDNDARKKGNGSTVFYGANPDIYGQWLDRAIQRSSSSSPMVFINAWNEWAEGAVLEPTRHNGSAILNRTTQVLASHSRNKTNTETFPMYGIRRDDKTKVAVVVHAFYKEEWLYIKHKLKQLKDVPYDLFVTLTERSQELREKIEAEFPSATITLVPNRGRDILPFIFLLPRLKTAGYEYVLKLHTKRSIHRGDGQEWLQSSVENLLPNQKRVKAIIEELQSGTAVIGPVDHFVALSQYMGRNYEHISRLLHDRYDDEKADALMASINDYGFFAGSMFWARVDAFDSLMRVPFIPEDFESERGQIDGTMAHAVERLLTVSPCLEDKEIAESSKKDIKQVLPGDGQTDYAYRR